MPTAHADPFVAELNEERLAALSPTAFENLVFDLLRADAMENLAWRTPGADGGRDIEGDLPNRDFAGNVSRTRWLVECKHYKSSVSWPLVWEKISYADSGSADFLLLVTTAKFSTRCLDEITKWNAAKRKPIVRVWPRHELIFRLALKSSISRKYGLAVGVVPTAREISTLSLHLSRMTQAALANSSSSRENRHLLAASALSYLLFVRSRDITETGSFKVDQGTVRDVMPAFVEGAKTADIVDFDRSGLFAYLSCLHVILKQRLILQRASNTEILVKVGGKMPSDIANTALLQEVAFWSAMTVERKESSLCLTLQPFK